MKKTVLFFLLVFCVIAGTTFLSGSSEYAYTEPVEDEVNSQDTFPVPPAKKNMIFYIQRTLNTNTIVYELNYNTDSTLNKKEPVRVYWIRYSEDGGKKDLSYLQRKYAYGVDVVCVDSLKALFKVNFVSYKKRDIFLAKTETGKIYKACMVINNKLSYIHKIFVRIDGGTFWVPHIKYVEIRGYDIGSGKPVTEKIIP